MRIPVSATAALFSAVLTLSLHPYSAAWAQNDADTDAAKEPAPSDVDSSYAFGARFARQFQPGEILIEEFIKGFRDQLSGAELRLSPEAIDAAFQAWQKGVQDKRAEAAERKAQENLAAAEAFLAKNAKTEGVSTTDSGLQYVVLEPGEGRTPKATDKVRVHYHGTFMDGEVFDSSKDRDDPFETNVRGVIPGWQEGLQMMKEGSRYRFFIHPKLAYGERDSPRMPANSLLIFEVEMLKVLTPRPAQAVTPPVPVPPRKQ